jgi:integrase
MLPEPIKELRVMTVCEERRLVEGVAERDLCLGAYVAILGETGLRKQEGLGLSWPNLDLRSRMLSVGKWTKSGKPRYVPLSQYAMDWLAQVPRIVGVPQVFTKPDRTPWKDPRETFSAAKKSAGLEWVTLHDLRHFRATQWVKHGVDLRTVKELLGHASIQTTEQYAHYAPKHAIRKVHEVERLELEELADELEEREKYR